MFNFKGARGTITSNLAMTILFIVLGIFVVWGIFSPRDQTGKLRNATVQSCERDRAKAVVVEEFAREAAAARRRSAVDLSAAGKFILAKNEIATAERYEGYAIAYDKLTPKDCNRAYP